MINTLRNSLAGMAVALFLVAAITALYVEVVHANPTTVALTLLLAVLVVAATWGLLHACIMAVLATLAFNYFFLPPLRTFVIAAPENWVALFVFLATAIIASQLSERARQAAWAADRRRHEVERLYAFSQQLLVTGNLGELLDILPRWICETFAASSTAMFLCATQQTYGWPAEVQSAVGGHRLETVAGRMEAGSLSAGIYLGPLRRAARTLGSIAVVGPAVSRETLDAASSLVATAIEHGDAMEQLSKTEAARESERLRSALLDSVTHEFRTPLTGIKAAVTSLLSDMNLDRAQRGELLTVIDEESDRLNRLVGQATQMAQVDAGQVRLELEPHTIGEAIEAALYESRTSLAAHPVTVQVPPNMLAVRMDVERVKEVLVQLLDNAGKYSPAGTSICISSEVEAGVLRTRVADQGLGIEPADRPRIFDKYFRGRNQRSAAPGTGMGLAIAKAIVEAHGGTISVTSQPGHGSVFEFTVPRT